MQDIFDTDQEDARKRVELSNQCFNEESQESSFVLKTLRDDLPEDEHTKGIVDLAVEARFLAKLSHPHIVSMR